VDDLRAQVRRRVVGQSDALDEILNPRLRQR